MKKLIDIANIETGHVFRNKIEYDLEGEINLLNMDSISEAGSVSLSQNDVSKAIIPDIKQSEIIVQNDILFKAKGLNNTAIFVKSIPANTTVTASCHIIRVVDSNILPEYVCYWLNSNFAKKHYAKASGQATGVTIANVSKSTLANLIIKIPTIEKQKTIIEFAELAKKEKNILKKIIIKQELLNTAIIEKELQKI